MHAFCSSARNRINRVEQYKNNNGAKYSVRLTGGL